MTDATGRWADLDRLLDRVLDGLYTDEDAGQLNQILRTDAAACRRYVSYLQLHGRLCWGQRPVATDSGDGIREAGGGAWDVAFPGPDLAAGAAVELPHRLDVPEPEPATARIIIRTSPALPTPFFSLSPSVGGWLLSYGVATVLMAAAVLGAWVYRVSHDYQLAGADNRQPLTAPGNADPGTVRPRPEEPTFVGRITGMADCRWADPQDAPSAAAPVPLARKYELVSGLMEISYNTGAKVILQGPCVYEVESSRGGFLSLGRLTARVETKGEGGRRKAEENRGQKPEVRSQESPFPLPPSPFVVRTPTAVIADLGTEFGVEVDRSGASRTHVFRGKVEMRVTGGAAGAGGERISLGEHESAAVGVGPNRLVTVTRLAAHANPRAKLFVRQMSERTPIEVFSTGVDAREGEPDPHWQLAAVSDDPNFKPQPAMIRQATWDSDAADRARSQWISAVAEIAPLPEDVTYTFRTTFDLAGAPPESAVLEGKFLVDDYVTGIRLNGRKLDVPEQHWGTPFTYWAAFKAADGFVAGANVLEIDVLNKNPKRRPGSIGYASPMALRVELHGSALRAVAPAAEAGQPRKEGKQ